MKSEKRLIDANLFREQLEEIRQEYREENTMSSDFAALVIETVQDEYLANAPTIDAVVLPCKIGDFVWAIRSYHGIKRPQQGRASEMFFTTEMKLHIVVSHISRGEWGKTIFATREEAEAAIAERKTHD